MGNISLEPLFNEGNYLGDGAKVTAVSEIGAVSHRTALTITDTAQLITIGASKNSIEIHNSGANPIYYGGSGVDSSNGIPLFIDYGKIFNKVKNTFSFYAVCAAGKTSTLRIIEYA